MYPAQPPPAARVIAAREFVGALGRLPTLSRSVQAAAVAR